MLLLLTVRDLAFSCAVSASSFCVGKQDVTTRESRLVRIPIGAESIEVRVLVYMLSILSCADPIIFRGLKSLTLKDTQQSSLLRLAAEGVSVSSISSHSQTPGLMHTRYTAHTPPSMQREAAMQTGLAISLQATLHITSCN